MSQPLRLHHVSLLVADTERALEFYCDILGLPLLERPELGYAGAWLGLGAQQLHLLELPNPDPVDPAQRPEHGGRDRHLALLVENLHEIMAQLSRHSIHYSQSRSGRRAVFCRDFDGNAIELIEQA